MRMVMILSAVLAMSSAALAAPPQAGSTNVVFEDPVYGSTVICDTLDQIKDIASAPDPNQIFKAYFGLKNEKGEPTCAATEFSADVTSVEPIGDMHQDTVAFHAWAVGISHNGFTAFVLYLEQFQEVHS